MGGQKMENQGFVGVKSIDVTCFTKGPLMVGICGETAIYPVKVTMVDNTEFFLVFQGEEAWKDIEVVQ